MPRKASVSKTPADDAAPVEGTRRSSRIADKPASAAPVKPAAPKKASGSKAKRAAEKDAEHEESEPAAKKSKPASKAESTAEAAPEAAAASASKPNSKASATKPASKPASKAKPASKKAAQKAEPAIAEESELSDSGDKMEIEDKENQNKDVKAAAAEAEAEVGELEIGDTLPDWTYKNEKDEDVEIAKLAGEKGLVLFLVPKADTPGCTTQACGFRDSYEEFEKYGYVVYGLSADAPAAQAKWQTKKNLQYSLLSDPKRKLIHALGAKTGNTTKRSHVVFEKGSGKLVEKKIGVKPADSPKHALEFIKKHHPEAS